MTVTGMSWVREHEYGTMRLQREGRHDGLRALYQVLCSDGTIHARFKNFGRFDADCRRICLAVALVLQDSGIVCGDGARHDVGILVSSADGAQQANRAYFQDYVAEGRTLGRANFFIYTLPTSPAAEAAIHFGLTGPLLYLGRTMAGVEDVLRDGADLVVDGRVGAMVCVIVETAQVMCAVLNKAPPSEHVAVTLDEALRCMAAGCEGCVKG